MSGGKRQVGGKRKAAVCVCTMLFLLPCFVGPFGATAASNTNAAALWGKPVQIGSAIFEGLFEHRRRALLHGREPS